MTAYAFRPMTAADMPMARRWLETPEVRRWWGDADGQVSLLEEDLDDPRMAMWIVSHQGRPFAYIQDYDPRAWNLHHLGDLPPGSRGIDQFIGEPEMLGRGHGSAFIRAHVDRLLAAGAPAVGTDPDPANARAIRAYEKAGFRALRETPDWEGAPVLLMVREARNDPTHRVMPGLGSGIHAFAPPRRGKTWMPGTRPAMAMKRDR